jgi:hypothetical protein
MTAQPAQQTTQRQTSQRTLVLVKPDGVRRGLTGEVIRRIEAKGYTLVALELRTATRDLLAQHYAEHEGKPFYEPLVEFMLSGPVVAMVVEGRPRPLPARSAATWVGTGVSRSSRTSCTVRTRPSRPSARSGSGSPSSEPPRPGSHNRPGVPHQKHQPRRLAS